jgi:hypothetical protein
VTAPLLIITVYGDPAGQGNLRTGKHGKAYHANAAELLPWRERIRGAALDVTGRHDWAGEPKSPCVVCGVARKAHAVLLGPVRLEAVVTVVKPKSAGNWPVTRGSSDWDHHGRAISDALTGVVFADDSQVTDGRVIKTYPYVHQHALGRPGVHIQIWIGEA